LEDLHWIDKTSEDYLAFLIESLAGMSHLLLTTHRPGYAVRWGDKTFYTQLALDLLTSDETEAMVRPHERMAEQPCTTGAGRAPEDRRAVKRQSGSHRTLACEGWADFIFAFHDGEEIGPRMLARIAKRTGLRPSDL
jgi:hypothetical protein